MPVRCPATDTITIDGADLELQCVEWPEDPDGRHVGDHHAVVPPSMGGEHRWTNTNPLPDPAPEA
jgi:hypothetical protein